MKKFIVSNRVFWAGVILASAALIGRSGGQAQTPQAPSAPAEVNSIKTHTIEVLDNDGKTSIFIGADKKRGSIVQIGAKDDPAQIVLMASPANGPHIVFHKGGEPVRLFSSDGKRDVPFRPGIK